MKESLVLFLQVMGHEKKYLGGGRKLFYFYFILFGKTVSKFFYFIRKFFYFYFILCDIPMRENYFILLGNSFIFILFYVTSL